MGGLVRELEVRVGDHRLLEVLVDAGATAAVRAHQLDLDARAVILLPLDLLFFEHVGLVLARVDAQLDPARRAPLAGLRDDDDRLAGGQLAYRPAALMPIPCCPRDCLKRWNFEP